MNICVPKFSIHLDKYLVAWLQDHMIILSSFIRNGPNLSSKATAPFYSPTNNEWELLLLQILLGTWTYQVFCFLFLFFFLCGVLFVFFFFGHSNRCVVLFHCCFNFIPLMTYDVEHLPICLFAIYIYFDDVYVQIFCPDFNGFFVFLLLTFNSFFCLFWTQVLSWIYVLQILSLTLCLVFSFYEHCLSPAVFNFHDIQFIIFFSAWTCFHCCI